MSDKVLEMVQVAGQTYLGFLEGSSLKDSMAITSGVVSELSKSTAAHYLEKKELGKLTSMNIGSVDTISFRDLTADELHLMEEVNYVMDRARKTALSTVVVNEFRSLLGK